MKVFVSWSGSRSQAVAEALRDWLPLVLHYVEPWLSRADLAAGERWADAVAKQLEVTNFGIVCVTRENVAAPWILFETGSLAKSLQESRVIPLLLDLEFSEIGGPLAQFQAKKLEKSGMAEVIASLNAVAQQPVPEQRSTQLFEALWPKLAADIASIPAAAGAVPVRSPNEILEELVATVRSVDTRLRTVELNVSERSALHRRRRVIPTFINEVAERLAERRGDPVVLLLVAGALRDEAPWLYELGLEAYRALRAGISDKSEHALERFYRALDVTVDASFRQRSFGIDGRMLGTMFRTLNRHYGSDEPPQELGEVVDLDLPNEKPEP